MILKAPQCCLEFCTAQEQKEGKKGEKQIVPKKR